VKNVVIVDYGLGNLYSIKQACIHVGYKPVISGNQEEILKAESLILPGMGAFDVAMSSLRKSDLIEVLNTYVASGKPLMGVCLGMQLLFTQSEEFGLHEGLGYIPGSVKRFPTDYNDVKLRVPNIGWCKIAPALKPWGDTPLSSIDPISNHMYFVHSYYCKPEDDKNILSVSEYNGFEYASSVCKDNVWGFQFHPEKSGEEGVAIYQNFLKI
jgi:glutamine amidotransferase